ncbi:MAG: ATP-binding cassette domain-containing protein [Thiobacillus sp.]|nr:ATP-binding cassette domain-containing protein [Thiobacillus sp.]
MESIAPRLGAFQLTLRTGTRTLVESLDLTLESGEVLGILGANGAGKSTLLTVLAGLALPAQGQVTLDGQLVASLPPLTRAQYIGLLPQGDEGGFFGSVADYVALGRYPFKEMLNKSSDRPVLSGAEGLRTNDIQDLAGWELTDLADRPLDTLSGGERQRARLAQLAVQQPHIALLDEPLTHLDPAHQARLLAWAGSEADAGRIVVLTLHDPNWAACHCDRLLFLHGDGRWQLGTPAGLLTPDSLEALYGPGTAVLWRQMQGGQPV